MRISIPTVALWFAAVVAWHCTAEAQFSTNTRSTTTGIFGSRTVGQGISSSRGLGTSGGLGAGRLGAGGSLAGQSGQLGQLGTTTGQIQAGARFLRQNVRPGDFVGAEEQGASGFVGRTGLSTGGGQGARLGISQSLRGRAGRANQRRTTGRSGGRSQAELAVRVRLGFTPVRAAAAGVNTRLKGLLERSPHLNFQSPVEVAFEGTTVTLRGVVANEHDRVLAEQLARLEPGVWAVKNELVVGGEIPARATDSAGAPSPAAPAAVEPARPGEPTPGAQTRSDEERP
ncbi:MAG TPA: BON domain-containing protein [Planctomycetaceae bacterium]|nr:BON domain-containing protein [Planctomycetaceae bacterium]